MDLPFAISIYFVVWWVVLFAILPLGVVTHHDAGVPVPGGGEPGSPVNPNLKRKFITTTWVAAIVWGVIYVVWTFFPVPLPPLPSS
jgi:predicted secreted protein